MILRCAFSCFMGDAVFFFFDGGLLLDLSPTNATFSSPNRIPTPFCRSHEEEFFFNKTNPCRFPDAGVI